MSSREFFRRTISQIQRSFYSSLSAVFSPSSPRRVEFLISRASLSPRPFLRSPRGYLISRLCINVVFRNDSIGFVYHWCEQRCKIADVCACTCIRTSVAWRFEKVCASLLERKRYRYVFGFASENEQVRSNDQPLFAVNKSKIEARKHFDGNGNQSRDQ